MKILSIDRSEIARMDPFDIEFFIKNMLRGEGFDFDKPITQTENPLNGKIVFKQE